VGALRRRGVDPAGVLARRIESQDTLGPAG